MELGTLAIRFQSDGLIQLNNDMSNLRTQANANFGEITRTVGAGMTAAGAAITGALGLSAKAASDFGAGLANLGTLGVTNLDEMGEAVLDYSVAMGQDACQANENLYQLVSRDVPKDNLIDVLTASAKGAAVGVGTVNDSLVLGTSVLNNYSRDMVKGANYTEKFEQVMGIAASAIQTGATTMGELGTTIGRVAPIASKAGISLEDLFASVATITSTGTQTSEAVSGLKAAISNIISPTSEATKVSEALGLQFDAAAIKSKGWSGFLQELQTKVTEGVPKLGQYKAQLQQQAQQMGLTAEKTKELRTQFKSLEGVSNDSLTVFANLFPSVEALNAALALTSESGAKKMVAAQKDMANGMELLNDRYGEWAKNNPELAFKQLKAATAALAISVGQLLLPALTKIVNVVRPVVNAFRTFTDHTGAAGTAIVSFIGGVGLLGFAFGPVIYSATSLVSALRLIAHPSLILSLGQAATGVKSIGVAATAARIPMLAMGGSLTATAATAGALAIAIGAAGTFIAADIVMFKKWRDAVEQRKESEQKLQDKIIERAKQLEAQGVYIDWAAMKEMTADQQVMYMNDQKAAQEKQQFQDWMTRTNQKALTEEQDAQRHNIQLNWNLTSEEAYNASLSDADAATKLKLVQADETHTQLILEQLGIRTAESRTQLSEQAQAAIAAAEQQKAATETVLQSLDKNIGAITELGTVAEATGDATKTATETMKDGFQEASKDVPKYCKIITSDKDGIVIIKKSSADLREEIGNVPGAMRNGMSEAAKYVSQYCADMNASIQEVIDKLNSIDPSVRHSPSINDRIEVGLSQMGGLFNSALDGITSKFASSRNTMASLAASLSAMMGSIGSTGYTVRNGDVVKSSSATGTTTAPGAEAPISPVGNTNPIGIYPPQVTVNINHPVLHKDADINVLLSKMGQMLRAQKLAKGVG